ncbi:MAG TPA: GAF domain-containing SpoIIE family protein phosphatase [Aggregatilineales bacterium]|nr:GAF domain-containing SpoIIE family protein phosphatase [Aggregatilineales bacterium]
MTNTTVAYDSIESLRRAVEETRQLDAAVARLARSLEKRGIKLSDEIAGMIVDIERDLIRSQQSTQSIVKQLDLLQSLVRSSALITSSLQLDQVLEQVLDAVISLTGAERAYLMLPDPETGELLLRSQRNWDQGVAEQDVQISRSVVTRSLVSMEPTITTNALDDERFQNAQSIVRQGLRSILCLPMTLDGRLIGILYADNRIQQGIFSQDILPLLLAFGTQAAIAIEKARLHQEEIQRQRLEEEMNVGRRIQLGLLPKACPSVAGWQFAAMYKSARIVSGDFYDFFELPGDRGEIGVVVADVADKGVPAAIFMALSRTMIRTTALSGISPSAALTRANTLIMKDSQSDLFLTVFYAILNPNHGTVVFSNGGHNRPLLLRAATGEFQELRAKGIIIGMFPDILLEDGRVEIAPGDILVMYTDGVTEAMTADQQQFGVARLRETIGTNREASAEAVVNAILNAVTAFVGDAPRSDDMTLVVVKRDAA